MAHVTSIRLTMIAGLALAGCASETVPPKDYMLTCLSETGAKGSYLRSPERIGANGLVVIIPADDGDARGALLMNACVESHHKAAGTMPQAPAKPSEPVMMDDGKLSLPSGYNLSSEDKALWPTLTLAQQKRALAFLKSGSTIQSSLLED